MRHPAIAPTTALLALLTLAVPAASPAQGLKIATSVPAGTEYMKQLQQAGRTIAKRTDGRVELEWYPSGVMGDPQTVLRKIRIGQLHGALLASGGIALIAPDAQVYSMPFLFRNRTELHYVRKRIDPVIRKRVREEGFVLAGIGGGGFTYLFSKEPIAGLEDLSKARVWVPEGDRMTALMFRNAGSQVVSLPLADVYTALQTGLVDTVPINPAGAIALQWHTGVNYYTDAPLLFLVGMMVIDERAFMELRKADREIVLGVLRETFNRLDEITAQNNAEALKALKANGIEAVQPKRPPSERRWEAIARNTLESLIAKGLFDPDLLNRVRSLIREYRRKHEG